MAFFRMAVVSGGMGGIKNGSVGEISGKIMMVWQNLGQNCGGMTVSREVFGEVWWRKNGKKIPQNFRRSK